MITILSICTENVATLENYDALETLQSKRVLCLKDFKIQFKGSPWNDFGFTEKVTHIMSCGCINENEYFNVYK